MERGRDGERRREKEVKEGEREGERKGERETGLRLRLFFQVNTDYIQVRAFILWTQTHSLFLFPGLG